MPHKVKFKVDRYLKAIVAFFAPVLIQIQQGLSGGLTAREIARTATTGLITALVVWAVPNDQT